MPARSNLIHIMADDLGVRDLGCFGSTFYETPNIDRLASQGLRHERAYASCAVCSPTRAAIISGRSPARIGCTQFIPDPDDQSVREGRLRDVPFLHYLPHDGTMLPQALREDGYQTWHVGKWHLGDAPFHPDQHGFDVNLGGCHWGLPMQGYQAPWGIPTLPDAEVPKGTWLDDHLTERAIQLLRGRDPERPFYLNLWYYLAHSPYQAPEELVTKYRRKAERLGFDPDRSLVRGEPQPTLGRGQRRITRRQYQCEPLYAAMVEQLDRCVGRFLDALGQLGLADDTLVVFTSDNGGDA
ncbi:MAG: sulfatase-like hydrolase/transferase, partial [Planctomycetota bacterium]